MENQPPIEEEPELPVVEPQPSEESISFWARIKRLFGG
jgi:hypothetical protein